ncbi:MAG: sulfur carrier protein ThiS [Deltaproteobacteria bacterium]|nr:sulfur carrier protein ThiS [Deltaproteobacteria bacterium]
MRIEFNGKGVAIEIGRSLENLLEDFKYSSEHVAVAVNGTFISKDKRRRYVLCENDCVEVLSPMQGG